MRNEIDLTDEQIESKFEELRHFCCVEDLVFTRDTIEGFKIGSRNMRERRKISQPTDEQLIIRGCQDYKGQPRYDLIVIDFGTVRAALLS